ncbi:hypothetical protein KL935_004222 [Ogataea polymorpha]|nr:hypothetical protein KL935_004222 [Ogataea polymorpha]
MASLLESKPGTPLTELFSNENSDFSCSNGNGVLARQVGDVVFVRLAELDALRAVRVDPGERLRDGTQAVQSNDVCIERRAHGLVFCVLVDKIMHGDDRREALAPLRSISFFCHVTESRARKFFKVK